MTTCDPNGKQSTSNAQAFPNAATTGKNTQKSPLNENVLLAIGVLSNGASGRAKLRVKQER